MKINKSTIGSGLALLLLSMMLIPMTLAASLQTDTFAVGCYDVGKAALDGQEGIMEVNNGWQGVQEVNRVTYDPHRISRAAIETRLKQSGAYIETLEKAGAGEK